MSAILVLWDIDHTLIENHGVNKETYALAFRLLTGREAERRARTDGRTEPEIIRDMLTRLERRGRNRLRTGHLRLTAHRRGTRLPRDAVEQCSPARRA